MSKEVTRSALAEALLSENPPILFEALDRKYFDTGHILTAKVLPPAEIDSVVPAQVGAKDAPIVVYCSSDSCQNSHQGRRTARVGGLHQCRRICRWQKDWSEAGLKLEK